MLFNLCIEVVDCDAECIQVDIVCLHQDDRFVSPNITTVDCLV